MAFPETDVFMGLLALGALGLVCRLLKNVPGLCFNQVWEDGRHRGSLKEKLFTYNAQEQRAWQAMQGHMGMYQGWS